VSGAFVLFMHSPGGLTNRNLERESRTAGVASHSTFLAEPAHSTATFDSTRLDYMFTMFDKRNVRVYDIWNTRGGRVRYRVGSVKIVKLNHGVLQKYLVTCTW